jgi:hypothetical protein
MRTEFENYVGESNWFNAFLAAVLLILIAWIVIATFEAVAPSYDCEDAGNCDEVVEITGL